MINSIVLFITMTQSVRLILRYFSEVSLPFNAILLFCWFSSYVKLALVFLRQRVVSECLYHLSFKTLGRKFPLKTQWPKKVRDPFFRLPPFWIFQLLRGLGAKSSRNKLGGVGTGLESNTVITCSFLNLIFWSKKNKSSYCNQELRYITGNLCLF